MARKHGNEKQKKKKKEFSSAKASREEKHIEKQSRKCFKKAKEKGNGRNEDAAFRAQLMAIGLEIHIVESDGNCLFRALSDQLTSDGGEKWKDVRKCIIDFERRNEEAIRPFVEDDEPWEDYLERLEQDGEWGGNLELFAATQVYRSNIVIHQLEAPRLEMPCPDASRTLHVSYHGESHYNSVKRLGDTCAPLPHLIETSPAHNKRLKQRLKKACPNATESEIKLTLESHDSFDDALAFIFELRAKGGLSDDLDDELPNDDDINAALVRKTIKKKKKIHKKKEALSTAQEDIIISELPSKPLKRGSACPCGSGKSYKKCCRSADIRKKRLLLLASTDAAPSQSVEDTTQAAGEDLELSISAPLGALRI